MKFRDFIINNKHQEEGYKWCVEKIKNLIYSVIFTKN